MSFKSFYLFVVFISLILFSCRNDRDPFQSTALIIGPDYGYCACCGGYIIEIADSTYRFENLPGSSTIDLANATFPVSVNLDWQDERNCGGLQYIEITRIEIKN